MSDLDFELMMSPGVAEYESGYAAGWKAGREALAREYAADWTPVAERVRAMGGYKRPTYEEIVTARGEVEVGPGEYRTMPRDSDWLGVGERAARAAVPNQPRLTIVETA